MNDRPILFSGPMVRALLAGTKTQTRRALRVQPPEWATFCQQTEMFNVLHQWVPSGLWRWSEPEQTPHRTPRPWPVDADGSHYHLRLPYSPGDRLWVRESWRTSSAHDSLPPRQIPLGDRVEFRADPERIVTGKTRPGIFLPRWASRLTLGVTGVRVERLQDISEADAIAEGVERDAGGWVDYLMPSTLRWETARTSYLTLWDDINGPGAWDATPWVVALTFTVAHANIDAMEAAHPQEAA